MGLAGREPNDGTCRRDGWPTGIFGGQIQCGHPVGAGVQENGFSIDGFIAGGATQCNVRQCEVRWREVINRVVLFDSNRCIGFVFVRDTVQMLGGSKVDASTSDRRRSPGLLL